MTDRKTELPSHTGIPRRVRQAPVPFSLLPVTDEPVETPLLYTVLDIDCHHLTANTFNFVMLESDSFWANHGNSLLFQVPQYRDLAMRRALIAAGHHSLVDVVEFAEAVDAVYVHAHINGRRYCSQPASTLAHISIGNPPDPSYLRQAWCAITEWITGKGRFSISDLESLDNISNPQITRQSLWGWRVLLNPNLSDAAVTLSCALPPLPYYHW